MKLKGLTALLVGTMVLVVSVADARVALRRNNPPGPIGGPGASPDSLNRPC